MTKRVLRVWRRRLGKFFTLRRRLTLWTAGLLFVLGLGLIIYINVMTVIRVPQAVSKAVAVIMVPTPVGESSPPVDLPPLLPEAMPSPSTEEPLAVEQIQGIAIREVRMVSLIGAGIFAVLGAIGAYWMAQQALCPVQRLSRLIQEIRVETLDRRLNLDAPQMR